jgi:hypothetical protein
VLTDVRFEGYYTEITEPSVHEKANAAEAAEAHLEPLIPQADFRPADGSASPTPRHSVQRRQAGGRKAKHIKVPEFVPKTARRSPE